MSHAEHFLRVTLRKCRLVPNNLVMENLLAFFGAKRKRQKWGLCGKRLQGLWRWGAAGWKWNRELCIQREAALLHTCAPAACTEGGRPIWDNKYSAAETKATFTLAARGVPNLHSDQYPGSWELNLTDRRVLRSESGHIWIHACFFFPLSIHWASSYHCPIIIHRLSAAVDKSNYGGLQDSETEEGCVFISQGDFWPSRPQTETLTSCPHNKESITQTSAPLFL